MTREVNKLKEQLESVESNALQTKKILAKEVRSLRLTVDEINKEKTIYLTQLNTLREALNMNTVYSNKSGENYYIY